MNKKICFIYGGRHTLHEEWAKVINAHICSSVPAFFSVTKNQKTHWRHNPWLHQFASILKTPFIPKSDIYIVEGISAALPAILKKRNSKIILINSDTFFYNYKNASKFKKWIYSFYLKKIDAMISTSYFVDDLAKDYLNVKSIVCYPHARVEDFSKVKINLRNKDIHFIGRLNYGKSADVIETALVKLNNSSKAQKIKFNVIGWTEYEFKHPDLFNETGLVLNPEKYLSGAGNYVNLSRHESFGINILEAMAAGLVPIISKNCGAKEVLEKIEPRLVIDLDSETLIKTYLWLNSDIKRKEKLSKLCKKEALKFNKKTMLNKFIAEFNKLAKKLEVK